MRRAHLKAWPALSHLYGLHPWDIDRLTYAELREYVAHARKLNKG